MKSLHAFAVTILTLIVFAFPLPFVHGTTTTTISVGSGPDQVAFDFNNLELYVANTGPSMNNSPNTVTAICNPGGSANCPGGYSPNTVVATIQLQTTPDCSSGSYYSGPTGIAYDSNNHDLYVANTCGVGFVGGPYPGDVSVIDGNAGSGTMNTVIATTGGLTVGNSSFDIAFDADTNMVFVANYGQEIFGISDSTNTVTRDVVVINAPAAGLVGIAFNPKPPASNNPPMNSNGICVTDFSMHFYCILDMFIASCPSFPAQCSFTSQPTPSNGQITKDDHPIGIAISVSKIFVAQEGVVAGSIPEACRWQNNNGLAINGCSGNLMQSSGDVGYGIAFFPGNGKVYVTIPNPDAANDRVAVWDPSGPCPAFCTFITVGNYPTGITVGPSCVYVANKGSNTVTAIC